MLRDSRSRNTVSNAILPISDLMVVWASCVIAYSGSSTPYDACTQCILAVIHTQMTKRWVHMPHDTEKIIFFAEWVKISLELQLVTELKIHGASLLPVSQTRSWYAGVFCLYIPLVWKTVGTMSIKFKHTETAMQCKFMFIWQCRNIVRIMMTTVKLYQYDVWHLSTWLRTQWLSSFLRTDHESQALWLAKTAIRASSDRLTGLSVHVTVQQTEIQHVLITQQMQKECTPRLWNSAAHCVLTSDCVDHPSHSCGQEIQCGQALTSYFQRLITGVGV